MVNSLAPQLIPTVLTIAGSDCSGGAGLQSDLRTFAAFEVYGASVVTALTVQNTLGVQKVVAVDADLVGEQIQAVLADIRVDCIKIGMLANKANAIAVYEALKAKPNIPVVLDPIIRSSSGARLLTEDAEEFLLNQLMPSVSVITPNIEEMARLLKWELDAVQQSPFEACQAMLELGAKAVILKGGHGVGEQVVDYVYTAEFQVELVSTRIASRNTHGTGCVFSSALAASLAKGLMLRDAARKAHEYVQQALRASKKLQLGQGANPLVLFRQD